MAGALKLIYAATRGEYAAAVREIEGEIAQIATDGMREMAFDLKASARADIAAAGFSIRWQNTLRVDTYPRRGRSANAAIHIWHKIPYAGVFAERTTIHGKPTLWLPLPGLPKRIGRKKFTAAEFVKSIGPLVRLPHAKKPLLGAQVRLSRTRARNPNRRISLALLRRGRNPGGRGVLVTVPVFIGVPAVTEPEKFDIDAIIQAAAARLPDYYDRQLRKRE